MFLPISAFQHDHRILGLLLAFGLIPSHVQRWIRADKYTQECKFIVVNFDSIMDEKDLFGILENQILSDLNYKCENDLFWATFSAIRSTF